MHDGSFLQDGIQSGWRRRVTTGRKVKRWMMVGPEFSTGRLSKESLSMLI